MVSDISTEKLFDFAASFFISWAITLNPSAFSPDVPLQSMY
jgi:hypothetical protein